MLPVLQRLGDALRFLVNILLHWWWFDKAYCRVSDHQRQRFTNAFSSPSVRSVHVKGNTFVLVNSMAFEGDGCNMCLDAEARLQQICNSLRCAQVIALLLPTCIMCLTHCSQFLALRRWSASRWRNIKSQLLLLLLLGYWHKGWGMPSLMPMTHAPETATRNLHQKTGVGFWRVCHAIWCRIFQAPDSGAE